MILIKLAAGSQSLLISLCNDVNELSDSKAVGFMSPRNTNTGYVVEGTLLCYCVKPTGIILHNIPTFPSKSYSLVDC
jgi:hypothetical protein